MDGDYTTQMAQAEQCEQVIARFRADDDELGLPGRLNFASKSQCKWQKVVDCYREAMTIYCRYNQQQRARDLLASLLDLAQTCDQFVSSLALQLLLTLKGDTIEVLERIEPGTRDNLRASLSRAIGQKLLEHEMDFWLLRAALEQLRALADNEQQRREADLALCHAMQLAASIAHARGNLDGAEGWYRESARMAQDRLGNGELAAQMLEAAAKIQRKRLERQPSSAFLQAMRSEAPSSREYVEAMDEMGVAESLNVLLLKEMQQRHRERFLPPVESLRAEYAAEGDKLARLVGDERLLLDGAVIELRVAKRMGRGLADRISSGFVDAHGNPRGEFGTYDWFIMQYVYEIAETVGELLRGWRDQGELLQQDIVAHLKQRGPDHDWTIFEAGLSRYFEGDYVCASHALIPQFEDVVRQWAREAGIKVKRLRGGVAGEALLSHLINPDSTEMRSRLGAGLFDLIHWYFVNDVGPFAYRHKVAHGWVRPEECDTEYLSEMVIFLTLRVMETPSHVP
jgi:hypothetical protein